MPDTASDLLLERLIDWGVDTIFGLPGDGINGFWESLRTHRDRIRYVHVRHEEVVAQVVQLALRGDETAAHAYPERVSLRA